jgi:hypothetical protein
MRRVETYYTKTSCVADGTGKLGVSHPLHTSLNDGYCSMSVLRWSMLKYSQPLIPSALVSSVLNGMLVYQKDDLGIVL